MVVQHNLTAMNSNRMLNITTGKQKKSTEKLSSGYKINRAADDAAGLSISEKMRKQIRGLTQASSNAQDGISMVQTADGAMAEVCDMLQRGNELAVKAANGTLSDDDRHYIQDEIEQLEAEIDRVRATTKFNEIYVLQGDVEEKTNIGFAGQLPAFVSDTSESFAKKGYSDSITITVDGPKMPTNDSGQFLGAATGIDDDSDGTPEKYKWTGTGTKLDFSGVNAGNVNELYNTGFCSTCSTCSAFINVVFTNDAAGFSKHYLIDQLTSDEYTALGVDSSINDSVVLEVGIRGLSNGKDIVDAVLQAASKEFVIGAPDYDDGVVCLPRGGSGHYVYLGRNDGDGNQLAMFDYRNTTTTKHSTTSGYGAYAVDDGVFAKFKSYDPLYTDCNLQIGADATSNNQLQVKLANLSSKAMGIETYNWRTRQWEKIDVTTADGALDGIRKFEKCLKYVASERSRMGAYQNRLEHTIANLDNVVENTTAAESAIRDTDMATEMVKYSNNNILAQAGQAMLAQANQSNQGVLSLLG